MSGVTIHEDRHTAIRDLPTSRAKIGQRYLRRGTGIGLTSSLADESRRRHPSRPGMVSRRASET